MLWNYVYETGVDILDEQNKELFRRIEMLYTEPQGAAITRTMWFLTTYFNHHFQTEERLHHRLRYPKVDGHKKIHADFACAFKHLKTTYDKSGHNPTLLIRISQGVFKWLKSHIMGHDKAFASYYVTRSLAR